MTVWGPYNFTKADRSEYRVKLYGQPVTTRKALSDANVTFKYGDLINKAIGAKRKCPDDVVEIDFAIYRLAKNIYIGVDPKNKKTYGTVAGVDSGKSTEKLVYSLIKAAKADVVVRLLLQKDGKGPASSDDISDITKYLCNEKNWGGKYLQKRKNLSLRHVTWGVASDQQMHNKFMLVSHVKGGEDNYQHCVYTTTANVDPWEKYVPKKKYYQTGVTVYGNEALYSKYKNYFGLAWEHACNQGAFTDAVLQQHAAGALNYQDVNDPYVSAYFYPMPRDADGSYWDSRYNPIARMLSLLTNNTAAKRYVKLNMGFLRRDFFSPFTEKLERMQTDKLNVKIKVHDSNVVIPPSWIRIENDLETHAKNYQFVVYEENKKKAYYSMTGSTNAKENGFVSKANNIISIRGSDDDPDGIYKAFKEMYEKVNGG